MFSVQNTRLNNIALNDVPSSLSSILKTPQDDSKVRFVKNTEDLLETRQKNLPQKNREKNDPNSKIQLEILTRKSNSKIQLEILTRNPNSKSNSKSQLGK